MKRIRVIVPVATAIWDDPVRDEFEHFKEADTEIDVIHLDSGPEAIEDAFDEAWATPGTLQQVLLAEEQGFAGAIVYCFADPALRAAKVGVCIPVVGLGEASAHFASLLGPRFGVVSVGPAGSNGWLVEEENLRIYELDHKCVGFVSVETGVLALGGAEELARRVLSAGRDLVNRGASVLVLGCGGLLGVDQQLSSELQVPVIVPGRVALKLCEAMVTLGLAHSKRAFTSPASKSR